MTEIPKRSDVHLFLVYMDFYEISLTCSLKGEFALGFCDVYGFAELLQVHCHSFQLYFSDHLLWCNLCLMEEYNVLVFKVKETMPFNEYLYITELLDLFFGGGM